LRKVAAQAGVGRKTARRYVQAAGVVRDGGPGQLCDEVIGQVVTAVRPARPAGHGSAWQLLVEQREQITGWVDQGLTVVKIGTLLGRRGVVVPSGRCTGSVCSAAGSVVAGRRRCGWPMVSRGWNVSSTSAGWVCCPCLARAAAGWCTRG
jgi:hypothetical protein